MAAPSGAAGASLLIDGLRAAAWPAGRQAPLRGEELRRLDLVEDAAIAIVDGRIEACGRREEVAPRFAARLPVLDGRGCVAVPGLVDCHTHAAFAGDRVGEFELRAEGADYERIHAAGGGILATVRATRAAGRDGILAALERHLGWMASCGTTTAEVKSGYGLEPVTELAQLEAVRDQLGPLETSATFLGAHAVPPEARDADAYLDELVQHLLPAAAPLAEAADVFVERGAFSAAQARRYLGAAAELGLALRLHGDQFSESGAVELAVELGARSVDHLEATGDAGVKRLAASDVAAVLLPASALFLGRPWPPARALVDAGAVVALASDFNPGSAFCQSLPLVMSLACTQLRLTPAEALAACTVNAAWVLGRARRLGRLASGFDGDVLLLDAPDWRHVAYHLGGPVVRTVVKAGRPL